MCYMFSFFPRSTMRECHYHLIQSFYECFKGKINRICNKGENGSVVVCIKIWSIPLTKKKKNPVGIPQGLHCFILHCTSATVFVISLYVNALRTLRLCWPLTCLDPGNMPLATGFGEGRGLIDNVALKRWSRFCPQPWGGCGQCPVTGPGFALSPRGWEGGSTCGRGHNVGFKHTTLASGIMSGPPALCSE